MAWEKLPNGDTIAASRRPGLLIWFAVDQDFLGEAFEGVVLDADVLGVADVDGHGVAIMVGVLEDVAGD